MNVEIIRNTLYKAYLEDFYKFCKNLGGKTAEVMCEILAVSFRLVSESAFSAFSSRPIGVQSLLLSIVSTPSLPRTTVLSCILDVESCFQRAWLDWPGQTIMTKSSRCANSIPTIRPCSTGVVSTRARKRWKTSSLSTRLVV